MKCVLIIGGSSDIGISFIDYFKKNNYHVILGYHNNIPNILDIDKIKCDVRNEEDIENIIKYDFTTMNVSSFNDNNYKKIIN